jgi:DNA-binding beta-propeller fold protein YncE
MATRRYFFYLVAVLLTAPAAADILDLFGSDKLTDGSRYAFAPSKSDDAIIAIDAADHKVAAIIEIPHVAGSVVPTNELDLLVATDVENNAATVINLYNREIIAQLDLGMRPDVVLPNAYDRFVTFGSGAGAVSTWDLSSAQQVFRYDGLDTATSLTFSFDGGHLFVVEAAQKRISVIDMAKKDKVAEIALGGDADPDAEVSALSRSADGYTGYVSITSENRIAVIDLLDWKVIESISVGKGPIRPFSTSDNRYVLVPNRDDQSLTVIATRTRNIVATVPTGIAAREVNTAWLDTVAFVMPARGDEIAVIDLQTFKAESPIKLPGRSDDGIVTSDSKTLLAAIVETGQVAVIDAQSRDITSLFDSGTASLEGTEIAVSNNVCH